MNLKLRADVRKLTLPVLVEQLFLQLLGVVNTAMVAHVGKEAVAAVGMVDAINTVINAVLAALAIGVTVVVAQRIGRRQRGAAGAATRQALGAASLLAGVIGLLFIAVHEPLLKMLYGSPDALLMDYMSTYLILTALAYPFTAFTVVGCGALRGAGETGSTMRVNVLVNVINLVLSYLLIYGVEVKTGGFSVAIPALGVLGAGIALLVARVCGVVYLYIHLRNQGRQLPMRGVRDFRLEPMRLRPVLAIAIPASMESLVFNGCKLVVQVIVVGMGTVASASNIIAFAISGLITIPGMALAVSVTTLVGHDVGRGDHAAARATIDHVLKVGSIGMGLLGLILIPVAPYLVGLFSTDPDIIAQCTQLVRLNCVLLFTWPASFMLPAAFKGAGDVHFALIATCFSIILFRLVAGYTLGTALELGVLGLWIGVCADWVIRAGLFLHRLRSNRWRHGLVAATA